VRSLVALPLIHANQILGVLAVEADADRPLDQSDVSWLANVGRQMSVAIQNTRLVADLEKALQQEKAARAQRVQTEKLAAMGRLVASVAHELNNPLQAMQNALYLVKLEAGLSPQGQEDLQVAVAETERMAGLISRLRETYRPATREDFQTIDLNDLVADVQRLLATHMRHNQVTCRMELAPQLPPVSGLRDQLKQAVLNLCLNAIEAMPTGGQLTMHTTQNQSAPASIGLTIADTGAGIAAEALSNIFDPFFTTKDSGTGLGLAITHDIIQRHQGRIEVDSQLGQGTTFRVWFPA
jgi:signal transduction histidine kinase